MKPHISYRKFFLYTGLVFLLLAGSVLGFYFYTINRYSQNIADLFDLLLLEEILDEDKELPEEGSKNSGVDNTSGDILSGAEQISGSTSLAEDKEEPPKEEPPKEKPPKEKPPAGERVQTGRSSSQPSVSGEPQLPEQLPKELKELEQKVPLFRKVDIKDQVFTLQVVKRFSSEELQVIYRLYNEGAESRSLLKKKLEEKFTPAEIDRVREIAQKYNDML